MPAFPQFRTKSVPASQQVLYQLSLRAPIISAVELMNYTFPLSPSALQVERSSLSTYTDVQGSPLEQGVSRQMDVYGLAPPVYTIEGTTGWDQHSTDGYGTSGLQSMQQLAQFLATYADLNQVNRIAGIPSLFSLEFYDYFTGNFWTVEPVGPQIFRQDATRPLLTYYRFRWAATRPAGFINDILDSVGNVLSLGTQLATTGLGQTLSGTLSSYTPAGPAPTAATATTPIDTSKIPT